MGQSVYPASGGSVIKSIQRGTATVAGDITITAVNASKATVTSVSNASTGVVGASGTVSLNFSRFNGTSGSGHGYSTASPVSISISNSGGTNTLVSAVSGAYLANSTTLTVTGACLWQVVEYS